MLICNIKYYSILKENVQISLKLESILHITDLFYLLIDIFLLYKCIDIDYIYKKYKLLIRFIERCYRFLNKNDLPHNLFQHL